MKQLLIILVFLTAGCSIISPPTFNSEEYGQFIELTALASESSCKPEENERMIKLSNRAVYYTAYLPHNELIAKGAVELDKTVRSLDHIAPDSAYCHIKLRIITAMSANLADAAGGKSK